MSNELLIESHCHETRVAVLEEGELVELHLQRASEPETVGNIYKGRVSKVVSGINAAFVDIGLSRDAFLFVTDIQRYEDDEVAAEADTDPAPTIGRMVTAGEELLVQVIKEPLPGKGCRISTQLSLPGRLVVLLPGGHDSAISRRIDDPTERERLKTILEELCPEGAGLIARTAANGCAVEDLRRDLERLLSRWRKIRDQEQRAIAPSLIFEEEELLTRSVRDLLEPGGSVAISPQAAYEQLTEYLLEVDPDVVERVGLASAERSALTRSGLEGAIDRALESRVWLESGGFVVINQTEALVAVDVNTGRFVDAADLEAAALQTNLEAAREVARQVRLRDLGGIIVVDFIDMEDLDHRARVRAELESSLARDRARSQITDFSEFGLIQITRKRMRRSLASRLTGTCPVCGGRGWVKNPMTWLASVRATLERRRAELGPRTTVRVRATARMVDFFAGEGRQTILDLGAEFGVRMLVERDDSQGAEGYELVVG